VALALLAPRPGRAASVPELICDPDAKITFQTRWLHGGSVLLSGGLNWDLPWTGHEPLTSGLQLKSELTPDPGTPEAAEVSGLADAASFLTFRRSEGSPLASTLYIEQALFQGKEDDGLVITELLIDTSIETPQAPPKTVLHVFHCRSR
jgi:hypothetical protein